MRVALYDHHELCDRHPHAAQPSDTAALRDELREALAAYHVSAPVDACWCELLGMVEQTEASLS